jgi:hypothetical protein
MPQRNRNVAVLFIWRELVILHSIPWEVMSKSPPNRKITMFIFAGVVNSFHKHSTLYS